MVEPDTVSQRLLTSGDIETNPGPAPTPEVACAACGNSFTGTSKPIRCTACHQNVCKTVCAGSRWEVSRTLRDGKPFVSPTCKGASTPPKRSSSKHPSTDGISPEACSASKCGKKIRISDDFLVCSECKSQWHKRRQCSEMTREQIINLGDRLSWICPNCEDIADAASQHQQQAGPSDPTKFFYGKAIPTKLRILQLNIDSVMSKLHELKKFLKVYKISTTKKVIRNL